MTSDYEPLNLHRKPWADVVDHDYSEPELPFDFRLGQSSTKYTILYDYDLEETYLTT